jgi:hypothetical protein
LEDHVSRWGEEEGGSLQDPIPTEKELGMMAGTHHPMKAGSIK